MLKLIAIISLSILIATAQTKPSITHFSPTTGVIGSTVIITGQNFSKTAQNNIVRFGGVKATITQSDTTSLTVIVPAGVMYGPISVTVNGLSCYSVTSFNPTFSGGGAISASTFLPKVDYSAQLQAVSVAMGDLDGNNSLDVIVSNFGSGSLSLYRNLSKKKNIVLAPPVSIPVGVNPHYTIPVDVDGDGHLDLVTVNRGSNTISILRNNGVTDTITVSSFAPRKDYATGDLPMFVATGDLDSDGKLDLVVANSGSNTISVYKNVSSSGSIQFSSKIDISVGSEPLTVSIKDLNNDDKPDILVANRISNSVSILWNKNAVGVLSDVSFDPKVDIAAGTGPVGIIINDMDGDGKNDLIVTNHDFNSISFYKNNSASVDTITATSFAPKVEFLSGTNPWALILTDLNGDSKPDFVTTNWGSANISILGNAISNGSILLVPKVDLPVGTTPRGLAIGDLDGDGLPDIASTSFDGNNISIYRNIINEPSAPTNLSIKSETTQVRLNWNKSIFGNIYHYNIYSGLSPETMKLIDSTVNGISDTSKTITGLTIGIKYYFSVSAIDSIRSESKLSNIVSVIPNDGIPPNSPLSPTITDSINYKIKLVWRKNLEKDFLRYRIYSGLTQNPLTKTDSTNNGVSDTSKTITTHIVGTRMYFRLTAVDSLGNESAFSKEVSTQLIDVPKTPINLTGTAGNFQVLLRWSKNSENNIRGYFIYGGSIGDSTKRIDSAFTGRSDTTKIILGLINKVKYYFYVSAVDSIGNESKLSAFVSSIPNDGVPPAPPQSLVITDSTGSILKIAWRKNTENDFIRYRIYVDTLTSPVAKKDSTTGGINDTTKSIFGLLSDRRYYLCVTSIDSFGNESGVSNIVNASLHIIPPPNVISYSPQTGLVGSTITIVGKNFSKTPQSNIVRFGGVKATITQADTAILKVIVPSGAMYGPITVTVNGLSCTSIEPFNPTFSGSGAISNSSFLPKVDYSSPSHPLAVSFGDLDGNNSLDVIVSNFGSASLSIYRNVSKNKNILLAPAIILPVGTNPHFTIPVDIDGDGRLDLVTVNRGSNTMSVLRNINNNADTITASSFAPKMDYNTGNLPMLVACGDLDSDGKYDLVVTNSGSSTISVYRNLSLPGTIQFSSKIDLLVGNEPLSAVIKDINNDGKPEIFVTNRSSNTISLLWNFSNAGLPSVITFAPKVDIAAGIGPEGIIVTDIDGDGKSDLMVTNHDNTTMSIYRNNSSLVDTLTPTSFAPKIDFLTGANPWALCLTDMNGDTKPDFVITNWGASSVSILGNLISSNSILMAPKVDLPVGSSPRGLAIGDLDGDGLPDIAATSYDANNISIYRNVTSEPLSVGYEENHIPVKYSLEQNYPNPFNPSTKISYGIPEATHVKVTIYDRIGREVVSLVNKYQQPGFYTISFEAGKYSSGVYYYSISTGKYTSTKNMILLK